jgi:hypothetical protein
MNKLDSAPLVDFADITQMGVYRVHSLPAPMSFDGETGISYTRIFPNEAGCSAFLNIRTGPMDRIGEIWVLINGTWSKSSMPQSEPRKPPFTDEQEKRIVEIIKAALEAYSEAVVKAIEDKVKEAQG